MTPLLASPVVLCQAPTKASQRGRGQTVVREAGVLSCLAIAIEGEIQRERCRGSGTTAQASSKGSTINHITHPIGQQLISMDPRCPAKLM